MYAEGFCFKRDAACMFRSNLEIVNFKLNCIFKWTQLGGNFIAVLYHMYNMYMKLGITENWVKAFLLHTRSKQH